MNRFLLLTIFLLISSISIQAQCSRQGEFQDGPDYEVNGIATLTFLDNGTKTLSFDAAFDTRSGPDLHVYLSKSDRVSTPGGILQTPDTIDLGLLQNNTGAQQYDLTSFSPTVNLNDYDYVIIHCKEFDHYWGNSLLGTPQGSSCATLSNDDILLEGVKVYPTLASNSLTIELNQDVAASFNIYSLTGTKVLQTQQLKRGENSVNLSGIAKGIYFVELRQRDKKSIKKIIIQ